MLRTGYRLARAGLKITRNWVANHIEFPVIILIYHRVIELSSDPQRLCISPDHFREHMTYLKENYRILRFEEPWAGQDGIGVVVTFDDGYADNFLEALPILEELNVPGAFFVSTGTIGTHKEFWWDELERLLLVGVDHPLSLHLELDSGRRTWPTGDTQQRRELYQDLHALILAMDVTTRESLLTQLRDWADKGEEGRFSHRAMTVTELRRLADSSMVTIGGHTMSHTLLSNLGEERQQEEILGSKKCLEGWLGRELTVFSYPFGGKGSFDARSVHLCGEAGYQKAAANWSGQAHRWTDPYRIPRQLVRDWDVRTFAAMMKRFEIR